MAIGSRPMIPATENCQARGIAKMSAYGARKPRLLTASALVIACLTS